MLFGLGIFIFLSYHPIRRGEFGEDKVQPGLGESILLSV